MKIQALQKRAIQLKDSLQKLVQVANIPDESHGRDGELATQSQDVEGANWNKGWGKYGKT